MTAIVNNARYSRNRGGNFQRSFLLFLAWHISHCLSVSDNYCPPTWKGTLNFLFFFFALLNLMWLQRQSGDWDWSPLNGWRWSFSFFFFPGEGKGCLGKKGSRIKMGMTFAISGGLLCASHSRSEGGDLHCKLAERWPLSQVDRRVGARFPHTTHPSFRPR